MELTRGRSGDEGRDERARFDWLDAARDAGLDDETALRLWREAAAAAGPEAAEERFASLVEAAQRGDRSLRAGKQTRSARLRGSQAAPAREGAAAAATATAAAAAAATPTVMRWADGGGDGGAVEAAVRPSGGEPLPAALRAKLEAELGCELAGVRLHHDGQAAAAARALRARAFTVGEHIYFLGGLPDWQSPDGLALIAHEVTHVVQHYQGRVVARPGFAVSDPRDALELEAEAVGAHFAGGARPGTRAADHLRGARGTVDERAADQAARGGEGHGGSGGDGGGGGGSGGGGGAGLGPWAAGLRAADGGGGAGGGAGAAGPPKIDALD
ncbi:MAG TPA: DUF4157 domain-containing protein, partial [Kofleriaceae bacterium]|nr:DUF4157 domain-containing protein [Kofleriaceae bacterium]